MEEVALQAAEVGAGAGAAAGLQDYLLDGKSGAERVEWVTGRNLPTDDPRYAAAVMSATAEQNPRVCHGRCQTAR